MEKAVQFLDGLMIAFFGIMTVVSGIKALFF